MALRGERFDGHAFVDAAVARGACALVVDRQGAQRLSGVPVPLLVVADTLRALGDMAHAARMSRRAPVFAVTGSNGKTTTKELIAAALGARGRVHKTEGNLNNFVGLPLTLFAWPSDAWCAVVELGMNHRHEIDRLTDIAAPTAGVITVVGPAHLEHLGTLENVARAKGELFEHLPADGVAVVNTDDPLVASLCAPLAGSRRRVTFGRGATCDVRLLGHEPTSEGLRVRLSIAGEGAEVSLPLPGSHNALNAAGAAAVAHVAGLDAKSIAEGLSRVKLPGSRLRVLRDLGVGVGVLDDTYNANPQSMRASFQTLAELAKGRKVAVLGDMFELGGEAARLHREVGEAAAASGIAWVLALGPCAQATAEGARAHGANATGYATLEALLADLDRGLSRGDFVVVKGSRGMAMERVVRHLEGKVA